ncbi:MAG: hypothetical protein C0594_09910, partial [Marinilabiliales bacterium]
MKSLKLTSAQYPQFSDRDSNIVYIDKKDTYFRVQLVNAYTRDEREIDGILRPTYDITEEIFPDKRVVSLTDILNSGRSIYSFYVASDTSIALCLEDSLYYFPQAQDKGFRLTAPDELAHDVSMNADGTKLVFSSDRNRVEDVILIDLKNNKRINLSSNDESVDFQPHIDAEGDLIVYTSDRDLDDNVYYTNMKTGLSKVIPGSGTDEFEPRIT